MSGLSFSAFNRRWKAAGEKQHPCKKKAPAVTMAHYKFTQWQEITQVLKNNVQQLI